MTDAEMFLAARNFLLDNRTDYDVAYDGFTWPDLSDAFDWVTDYFDLSLIHI